MFVPSQLKSNKITTIWNSSGYSASLAHLWWAKQLFVNVRKNSRETELTARDS